MFFPREALSIPIESSVVGGSGVMGVPVAIPSKATVVVKVTVANGSWTVVCATVVVGAGEVSSLVASWMSSGDSVLVGTTGTWLLEVVKGALVTPTVDSAEAIGGSKVAAILTGVARVL